jgi:hypothetical protein
MAFVRLTVLRPTRGHRDDALQALRDLDTALSEHRGIVMSLVFHEEAVVGRIAVWESEAEADEAAGEEQAMAIRSRIQGIPGEHIIELLAHADTGMWSPGALQLLAGTLGWKEPKR